MKHNTLSEYIKNFKYVIALTGAGISVESGIPTFRVKEGLWETYISLKSCKFCF